MCFRFFVDIDVIYLELGIFVPKVQGLISPTNFLISNITGGGTPTKTFRRSSNSDVHHSRPSSDDRVLNDGGPSYQRDDNPHERSEIILGTSCSDALVFPSRLRFPDVDYTILVSSHHMLLFLIAMCIIWSYCKYLVENCRETDSFTVDCGESVRLVDKSIDRMGFRYPGGRKFD